MKAWLLNHGKIKWKHLYVDLSESDFFRLTQGYPLEVAFYTDDNHDPLSSPIFRVLVQKNLDKKFVETDLKGNSLTDMYKADEKNADLVDLVREKLQEALSLLNNGGKVEKELQSPEVNTRPLNCARV